MDGRISPLESDESAPQETRAITLAHEPAFALGILTVDPGSRRICHPDGREEFLEPRVMQVLVALARSRGMILTRDDLIERCWTGRIVGEDAITRVMSRLRKLSDTIGKGIFTIETLTKVGYRLVLEGGADANSAAPREFEVRARPNRRAFMMAGAAAGIAAVAGGGALLYRQIQPARSNAEADLMMVLGWQAWTQGTADGSSQAIGLYRRAIAKAPEYADAWGFLGSVYADRSHGWASAAERESLRARAREAGQRALELEPGNAYGRCAIAYARPLMGNWLSMEQVFSRGLQEQPEKWCVNYSLALAHTRVGRLTEAASRFAQVRRIGPTATQFLFETRSLWGVGRLDEADRLMDEAITIYATNPSIWFAHVNMLLFSGRESAAVAFAQDVDRRPANVSDEDVQEIVTLAGALESKSPAISAAVADGQIRRAREAAGSAPYAIQVLAALDRVDEAFMLADAYYFSRGFAIPDVRVPPGRTPDVSLNERSTAFLFMPPARAMRADPRFQRLVQDLGLERYWQQADAQPDFRSETRA